MNSNNPAAGTWALAIFAVPVFLLIWGVSSLWEDYQKDHFAVTEIELQTVILTAVQSVEAKSAFEHFLKEKPNPTRSELDAIRSRIDEIKVTEMARTFAGDASLHVKLLAREKRLDARIDALTIKDWGELNGGEYVPWLLVKILPFSGIFTFAILMFAFFRKLWNQCM